MSGLRRIAAGAVLTLSVSVSGCLSVGGPRIVESGSQAGLGERLFGRGSPKISYSQTVEEVPIKLKNPAILNLRYANLMAEAGNLPEAREHYQNVLKENPQHLEALLGLARIHQLSGRPDEAEQEYNKALRAAPDSPVVQYSLGRFYASQGRWNEAAELLNQAVMNAPDDRNYRYELAVALVHTGRTEEALPHFIRTVGDAEAHYNIGLLLQKQNRLREAEGHFRLALSKKPDFEAAQYWLGRISGQQSPHAMTSAAGPVDGGHSLSMTPQ